MTPATRFQQSPACCSLNTASTLGNSPRQASPVIAVAAAAAAAFGEAAAEVAAAFGDAAPVARCVAVAEPRAAAASWVSPDLDAGQGGLGGR